jgi:hypothetical protein
MVRRGFGFCDLGPGTDGGDAGDGEGAFAEDVVGDSRDKVEVDAAGRR